MQSIVEALEDRKSALLTHWTDLHLRVEAIEKEIQFTEEMISRYKKTEINQLATLMTSSRVLPYFHLSLKNAILESLKRSGKDGASLQELVVDLLKNGVKSRASESNLRRSIHVTISRLIADGKVTQQSSTGVKKYNFNSSPAR